MSIYSQVNNPVLRRPVEPALCPAVAIFRAAEERAVRELLAEPERPVELALVLGPYETTTLAGSREVDPERETRAILDELASLSERIAVSEHGEGAFGARRYPTVVVLRD